MLFKRIEPTGKKIVMNVKLVDENCSKTFGWSPV